ncbi:MAG TPA: zf-HC2 domain-containing protein [Planctomycetota bacterium]|nr:zf-HC2 domain-containing protein [Planctomycetota bacterium]
MLRRSNCRTVRDLLPLHAGGDLPPDRAVLVDEHLHVCLTCFREFREYAAMRGRLGVLAEEPLPDGVLDGFTDEVMACVALGEEGPAATLPSARRWRPDARLVTRWAAAAALLVAAGAGLWSSGWFGPSEVVFRADAPHDVATAEPVDVLPLPIAPRPVAASLPVESPVPLKAFPHSFAEPRNVLAGDLSELLPLLPRRYGEPSLLLPEPGRQKRLRNQ